MSKMFRGAMMMAAVLTSVLAFSAISSAQSAELTNGKNGNQPNTLDSESDTGSAGVSPSRDILKKDSTQAPNSMQSGEQMPMTEKPKQ